MVGCAGNQTEIHIPDLVGENLAVAESKLNSNGIPYQSKPADGRLFIGVSSNWTVSRQSQDPGTYCIDGPNQGLTLYAAKN
ncbi:PASTA domain-containing protein [Streptomyces sp. NPDC053427]|uniref:PASTA domain-containing protein n=1 Tax=Streptomyces sp. NPDC053427 TaxID=3365701 RepID=UPI0037D3A9A4